ncbi:MAG TPA: GatB/YqeY domain-containing protein [Allosphingosinicella sp.]|nr:GatB/YqeY domain-containing protein [Allosphingosinicella sp.]
MIRDEIKQALVGAMKAGDQPRRDAIRLIQAALKNREIELRGTANPPEDDVIVMEVLQKMIKQRRESIALYEQGGRAELAAAEAAEVAVIETFLPQQMGDDELGAAVEAIIAETGASAMKDMGRVMALVKERLAGQADMSKASAAVKARLS